MTKLAGFSSHDGKICPSIFLLVRNGLVTKNYVLVVMSYGTVTAKPASDRPVDESGDDQGASSPLLSDNEASGESNNEQVESRRSWKQNLFDFYQKNIGLVFVFLAQMFASVVSHALVIRSLPRPERTTDSF